MTASAVTVARSNSGLVEHDLVCVRDRTLCSWCGEVRSQILDGGANGAAEFITKTVENRGRCLVRATSVVV
jgi:hypothetical protein